MLQFLCLLLFLNGLAQSVASLLQQGLVALQHGQLTEARADLEEASRLDPSNPYAWASLAETYLQFKDTAKASDAAGRAEKLGSGNPLVSHALAMYYSESGQFAEAAKLEAQFAQSSKADGNALSRVASLYLRAGNVEKGLPFAEQAGAKGDQQIAFEYAQALLQKEDFTRAAEVIESGLKKHADDAQLVLALGVARYGQRRFEDAIQAFLRVIQIDPNVEQPYVFLGRMLDQAGAHLQEIKRADQSWAERFPQNANAQLVFAKALVEANNKDPQAEVRLRRSIDLDGSNWEAHYELGVLLENRHDYPAAAAELERTVELEPKQPMPHYHLARVYDRLGQPDRAKRERELHAQLTGSGSKP